uniref:Guanylate cyclase domain-containing protein n=1 Tax=Gongylonema pulchrum TaxID=637853 RepID=A0A183EN17_9BILA
LDGAARQFSEAFDKGLSPMQFVNEQRRIGKHIMGKLEKANLILNVDGAIGIIFVDILRYSGMFTQAEAQETIEIGALNGLFVLGRSIGFVGHYLDQRRLKQGLYRHPWDDITYVLPEGEFSTNRLNG